MPNDPFCDKKISDTTYYENGTMRVVYDKYPVLPGHSLIIPKRHVVDFMELTEGEITDLYHAAKEVIPVILRAYSADGSYAMTMQIGKYAGMSVHHLHMHIIPRNSTDEYQVDNNKIYRDIGGQRTSSGSMVIDIEVKKLRALFKHEPTQQ
jgi:diadenosine tetraphosphate (Ap4A) HIT family hydrolase